MNEDSIEFAELTKLYLELKYKYEDLTKMQYKINIYNPILEIKPSGEGRGDGVFAVNDIKSGTILGKIDPNNDSDTTNKLNVISRKINDLLYTGNAKEYPPEVDSITNIGYIIIKDQSAYGIDFFIPSILTTNNWNGIGLEPGYYMRAIRYIKAGEELSRPYGKTFWMEQEFIQKYSDPLKPILTNLPVYTFVGEYRIGEEYNHCLYLYSKLVDNKYYYAIGFCSKLDFLDVEKFNSFPIYKNEQDKNEQQKHREQREQQNEENWKHLIDCSKPDNSEYLPDEPILYNGEKYLNFN